MNVTKSLIQITKNLSKEISVLKFSKPVFHTYNPLDYAWKSYQYYIEKYCTNNKKVIFLGINPGPWGMVQTGIPFGEVNIVKNWLNIIQIINKPKKENLLRPILGFNCNRSEISGGRLWELFKKKFLEPKLFFKDHFVINYCPLFFMTYLGKNITPNNIFINDRKILYEICNKYICKIVEVLNPSYIVSIGNLPKKQIEKIMFTKYNIKVLKILHPSPINPKTNCNWLNNTNQRLIELNIWK